jgi:hypothetical protein
MATAKYKGRSVKINKPMRGDVKKFKVFVKDRSSGKVKKVNFGSKTMSIKKNIPARQKSFFARFRPILAKVKGQAKNYSQLLHIGQYNHGKKDLKHD